VTCKWHVYRPTTAHCGWRLMRGLRQRIAELEKILATDVCNNPEAAALVERGAAAPAPVPAKKE
jgi:hypothetical protein